MNSFFKKTIFVLLFVLATLVLPGVLLLIFVDASQNFSAFVIVFAAVIFAVLGYICISVQGMEKKLDKALSELKMQNAAIAYKISNSDFEMVGVREKSSDISGENVPADTSGVPLNPADPLVMPDEKIKGSQKKSDDGFDDFQ